MGSLRCVNLCKSFDGTAALDGLALSLPARGLVAIIGPNGAGKTTLLNVFTGFLRPDMGEVFLDEQNLTRLPPHRIVKAGLARTFQELRLISLISVLDNVMLARQNQKGERLWRALRGSASGPRSGESKRAMGLFIRGLGEGPRGCRDASYGQQKLSRWRAARNDARILLR